VEIRIGYDGLEFCFEIVLDVGGLSDCHLKDMIPLSLQFLCTMPFTSLGRLIYTMKALICTVKQSKTRLWRTRLY
jgi:hypothetical protein